MELTRQCKACDGQGTVIVVFGPFHVAAVDRCHACDTGRITERIPASDALADAETLRALTAWDGRSPLIGSLGYPYPDPNFVVRRARAAFRAVPGLRDAR